MNALDPGLAQQAWSKWHMLVRHCHGPHFQRYAKQASIVTHIQPWAINALRFQPHTVRCVARFDARFTRDREILIIYYYACFIPWNSLSCVSNSSTTVHGTRHSLGTILLIDFVRRVQYSDNNHWTVCTVRCTVEAHSTRTVNKFFVSFLYLWNF